MRSLSKDLQTRPYAQNQLDHKLHVHSVKFGAAAATANLVLVVAPS